MLPASTAGEFYAAVHETLSAVIEDNATFTQVDNRIGSFMYEHRMACVRYMRAQILKLIEDPATTRGTLRLELAQLAKQVEEHGPPAR